MDDVIGTAFKGFSNALPAKFSLTTGAGTPNEFQIQGRLDVREVVIDPCQSQVNAVRQAQTAVNDVNNQIKALQEELKKASPAEKPFLISEIKRVREEELPVVQDALGAALTRLSICRSDSLSDREPTDLAAKTFPNNLITKTFVGVPWRVKTIAFLSPKCLSCLGGLGWG
jgi:hypothetical protein